MTARVFISAARSDSKLADTLAMDLRRAGYSTATSYTLAPGIDATSAALRAADALIVLLTPQAGQSARVRTEVKVAEIQGLPLLPVLASGTLIPARFKDQSIIDIRPDHPDGLWKLLDQLQRIRPGARVALPGERRADTGHTAAVPPVPRAIVLLTLAVGLAGIAFTLVLIAISDPEAAAPARPVGASLEDPVAYTVDTYEIRVPGRWVDISSADKLDTLLDDFDTQAPALEELARSLRSEAEDDLIRLLLLDPVTGENLILATEMVSRGLSYAAIEAELRRHMPELGVSIISAETVRLPAGDMLRIHAENRMFGTLRQAQFLYYLLRDGVSVTVTFTAPAGYSPAAEARFDSIMRTFRVSQPDG
ncbi:MAG: toll/interleukin-1 receptor domain-containing protein [Chloroflexota bacterium]